MKHTGINCEFKNVSVLVLISTVTGEQQGQDTSLWEAYRGENIIYSDTLRSNSEGAIWQM